MNLKDPQWVIALANSIMALGIALVVVQVWIAARGLKLAQGTLINSVKQLELNREALEKTAQQLLVAQESFLQSHDLERRKEAINHMKDWTRFIAEIGTGSKCFAEKLDFDKSKQLWEEKVIKISKKDKQYLERTVTEIGIIEEHGAEEAILSPSQSSLIRKQVVSYLNLLETILAARRHNVADCEMLEEQFGNLVTPKEGKQLLPNFRKVAGGVEAFPSIEEFVKEIESKKSTCQPGKAKLGQLP